MFSSSSTQYNIVRSLQYYDVSFKVRTQHILKCLQDVALTELSSFQGKYDAESLEMQFNQLTSFSEAEI